jgi:hypothetical protein
MTYRFTARRLPRPSRRWVLENSRGHMMPSMGYHATYGDLLHAASLAGFSSFGIELKYRRPARETDLRREIEDAMWAGDTELLDKLAPCGCCCHEHTHDGCPARLWEGCRGSGQMTYADVEVWAQHYERFHGMTREQFFG